MSDTFHILSGPASTLKPVGHVELLFPGMPGTEGLESVAPPGTDHSQVVQLGQEWTSEDVTSMHVPQTPIDGTIGQVQFPVGQDTGMSETFDDNMPVYIAANADRSGDVSACTLPLLQLS